MDGIIRHKGFVYEQDKTDITNDIALVHLSSEVNMTREISPVCLPALGALMPAGKPCYVTGWGDEKGMFFRNSCSSIGTLVGAHTNTHPCNSDT